MTDVDCLYSEINKIKIKMKLVNQLVMTNLKYNDENYISSYM